MSMNVVQMVIPFFATLIGVVLFYVIFKYPYHGLAIYYASNFFRNILFPDIRVRTEVMIQLATIAFVFVPAYLGNRRKAANQVDFLFVNVAILFIFPVMLVEVTNGYFAGYNPFQIAVDTYKVLEIIILAFFIRIIWCSTESMTKAFNALIIEMILFGSIELFVTERGGTGLCIVMTIFPMFFSNSFFEKRKYFWLITILSILFVVLSETRTFIIAFVVGLFLVIFYSEGKYKKKILSYGSLSVLVCIIVLGGYITFFNGSVFRNIFERFAALINDPLGAGGYRIYEMRLALQKFAESPLLGKGYGYLEYVYIQLMGYFEWGDFMHNSYVEILAKTGIFGSSIYFTGLLIFIVKLRRLVKNPIYTDERLRSVLIGGYAATIAWCVVFFAAPYSSYGYLFFPGMISLLYFQLFRREANN